MATDHVSEIKTLFYNPHYIKIMKGMLCLCVKLYVTHLVGTLRLRLVRMVWTKMLVEIETRAC